MLQHVTIVTDDRTIFELLLKSALDNERKMVARGLERTRERLAAFEREYEMSSAVFEEKLNALELEESVAFSEWRMELGMLRLLERQYQALENARLN